ncbi:MAG TPA: transcriptional regulator [Pseudogracilibacillus sp.]|nr:transcriptional regulator [Pseudogracilibacillus sp.]
MPQWKVAKFIGINKQTYHLKETGQSDFTIPEAKRLTKVFGCTLNDLF